MKLIHKYGLIALIDRKFLINRKKNTSLFLLPGGKPTPKETPEDCLVREIREEHGCFLQRDTLKFLFRAQDVAANESDTNVAIDVYAGIITGNPTPSSEIIEQRWFGRDDDPSILSPVIKNKILPELIAREVI